MVKNTDGVVLHTMANRSVYVHMRVPDVGVELGLYLVVEYLCPKGGLLLTSELLLSAAGVGIWLYRISR